MAGLDTEQSEAGLGWLPLAEKSVKVASFFPLTSLWALLAQGEGGWPAVTQTLATPGTPCGSAADPRTGMKASTPLLIQQNGTARFLLPFYSLLLGPVPWFPSQSCLGEGAPFRMAPALASGSHMAPEHVPAGWLQKGGAAAEWCLPLPRPRGRGRCALWTSYDLGQGGLCGRGGLSPPVWRTESMPRERGAPAPHRRRLHVGPSSRPTRKLLGLGAVGGRGDCPAGRGELGQGRG